MRSIRRISLSPRGVASLLTIVLAVVVGRFGWWTGLVGLGAAGTLGFVNAILKRPVVGLSLFVFTAAVYPRARFLLPGNMPVYWLDVFTLLLLFHLWFMIKEPLVDTPAIVWAKWLIILFAVSSLPSLVWLYYQFPDQVLLVIYSFIRRSLVVLIALALIYLPKREEDINQVILALYYGTVATSIWALAQAIPLWSDWGLAFTEYVNHLFGLGTSDGTVATYYSGSILGVRAQAGYVIHNVLGGFYALSIPLLFLMFLNRTIRPSLPMAIGIFICLAGAAATYSRNAWLSISIGVFIALFASRRFLTVLKGTALFLTVVGVLVFVVIQIGGSPVELMAERIQDILNPRDSYNIRARTEIGVPRFLEAVSRDPQFLIVGESLSYFDLRGSVRVETDYLGFVSNSWLLTALDTGVPSLLIFVALYFLSLFYIFNLARSMQCQTWHASLASGLSAVMVSAGIAYAGDNYGTGYVWRAMYFAMLGLAWSVIRLCATKSPPVVVAHSTQQD